MESKKKKVSPQAVFGRGLGAAGATASSESMLRRGPGIITVCAGKRVFFGLFLHPPAIKVKRYFVS